MSDIPGFGFYPTEYELVCYFLRRKVKGQPLPEEEGLMEELNIYESEQWNFFNKESSEVHYVFTKLKKKGNGQSRVERTAGSGTWDGQNSQPVKNKKGEIVGLKKYFVFEQNGSRSKNGNWVMHEFSLIDENLSDYVLCRILNKEANNEDKEEADNETRHSNKKRKFDEFEDAIVQEENHGSMMKTQEILDSAHRVGKETSKEEFNAENILSELLKMDDFVGGVDLDIGDYSDYSYLQAPEMSVSCPRPS